jgi:HK97 family phage major capsid protein
MQDSFTDVGALLAELFGERFGRGLAYDFTLGNGSAAPQGITVGASSGATAAASAITRTNLLNLIFSLDKAYRQNGMLMMNDSTLKSILLLEDGDDRPLYQDSPIVGGAPTIEGYKYIINNDMAAIGANAISMLFGDFKKFTIREVKGMTLVKFEELYMASFQKGFTAFGRWDSRVMNSAAIKKLTHNAT